MLARQRTFVQEKTLHRRSAEKTSLLHAQEDEEDEDAHRVVLRQLQAEWAEQRGQQCKSEPLKLKASLRQHGTQTLKSESLDDDGSCAQFLRPLPQSDK
jgi:hypothetical protein